MLPGSFFVGAMPATLEKLRQTGSPRHLEAGQTLFHEGDASLHFIVVIDGRVRIWRSAPTGARMTVDLLGPGAIPGCVAVFRGIPYPATATAMNQVAALTWPAERVRGLLHEDPALAANALAIVGARNLEVLQRLLEVSTEGVEQRLARTLLRLADAAQQHGVQDAVEVRASRQDLAELTAATLHTVSRFIGRWETIGIVSGGRGRILVHSRAALAALCSRD